MLLIVILVFMSTIIFAFVLLTVRFGRREMKLRVRLIKQMESTLQAEGKNMKKSLAFASASRDVRASLSGLAGLIEICHSQVMPQSELHTNLIQMETCVKDLLGILNSILDTSKIEAGQMQLDEEQFDLEQLLEDVGDLYYPIGMKKGVDVVLDPYDGSITKKFSHVKGDRRKLKQILCNLLSNAVKFTSDGHVTLRGWARKPGFENEILASKHKNLMSCMICFSNQIDKVFGESQVVNSTRKDPNCMEYIFEVNDTGKGIPKERQKSVFENYVQVKETTLGQEGTGLGLGIVQSLVRLMGGEIGIVDKEVGERGTCFRFNVFFIACGAAMDLSGNAREDDIEAHGGLVSCDFYQCSGSTNQIYSPKIQVSQVILFIQSIERRHITKKFMERQGIRAHVVEQHEQLLETFKRIKQKLHHSCQRSSSKSDVSSLEASSTRSKDVPLSSLEGTDSVPPIHRRTSARGFTSFVLIVIDTAAGPFREISRAVAEFRRDLMNNCFSRVVWLDKPGMHKKKFFGLDEDKLPATDLMVSKPLHGSRLRQIMGLLPEFGGTLQAMPIRRGETLYNDNKFLPQSSPYFTPRKAHVRQMAGKSIEDGCYRLDEEIQELDEPRTLHRVSVRRGEDTFKAENIPAGQIHHKSSTSSTAITSEKRAMEGNLSRENLLFQKDDCLSSKKPLTGKKILVADDDLIGRKIATTFASQLGAYIFSCVNGKEALEAVCKGLDDQYTSGASKISTPFDYILMDCEMPVMNGIEATRRIREVEGKYGVHIQIIVLTAHERGDGEINKMIEAGVDAFLTKPLNKENLLKLVFSELAY